MSYTICWAKNDQTQKFTSVCFYLHEVLEQVQQRDSTKKITTIIAKVGQEAVGRYRGEIAKRQKGISGDDGNILYLDGVVVLSMYIFVKTHWNIHWKHLCISLYVNYSNYISIKLTYLKDKHSDLAICSSDTEGNTR